MEALTIDVQQLMKPWGPQTLFRNPKPAGNSSFPTHTLPLQLFICSQHSKTAARHQLFL